MFYTEFQPCGTPSGAKMAEIFAMAAKDGFVEAEWTHRTAEGEDFPTKVTLARIEHDETMVVAHVYDMREIKKLEHERLQAVEEASRAKSRFLARMSHEIRTPLSAVLSISEIQLRKHEMPPHTEEAFTKIYNSSKTLINIVNDILDFSKIEAGKMSLQNSEYETKNLISDVEQLFIIYSEQKNISFKLHMDALLPVKLKGDAMRLRQIISNLLTNAFKYTEEGTVDLFLSCEKSGENQANLVISIHDTGIGMSADQLSELKKEYVRLHENEKPFVGGTGLGIPIVYSLAQLMDAQFDITSTVGQGTHALVRVPQEMCGTDVLGPELATSLQNFEIRTMSITKELEFVPEPMPYGKVLVVDDVDTNLFIAEAMLEAFEVQTELCDNGFDTVEKIKQGNEYDIIFLDHSMPGMDGVEVAIALREMGYTRPIVALTANAIMGQAELFMNNGFSGFMTKPVDIKILNSYLVRFVKNKNP
jgi:signal transduction histidine kinase/CheY-like chemotaxis protein